MAVCCYKYASLVLSSIVGDFTFWLSLLLNLLLS